MNIVRTTTLLLLLSATALSAQTTITLDQVRQAALANAPATTDKQLYLDQGDLRAKSVNDAWLPQVKAVAVIALPQGTGDAVVRPQFEFRIVFRVGVHRGDERNPAFSRKPVQRRDRRENLFGARHVEGAPCRYKIELRIDIEKYRSHAGVTSALPFRPPRTVSNRDCSSSLYSTR